MVTCVVYIFTKLTSLSQKPSKVHIHKRPFSALICFNPTFNEHLNQIHTSELDIKETTNFNKICFIHRYIPRNRPRRKIFFQDLRKTGWHQLSYCKLLVFYGVYISQLIRYSRTCAKYQDFLKRAVLLAHKLLQGCIQSNLKSSLLKFYGRHHELLDPYGITASQLVMDMLPVKQQ